MPTQRRADLQLRGRAGTLRGRVFWPGASGDPAPFLVALSTTDDDSWWQELGGKARLVVLSVTCAGVADAVDSVEWAAENAAMLGGDQAKLLVAGVGSGGGLAASAAQHARASGWPRLRRQVLICASPVRGTSPVGVAPATVVTIARDPDGDEGWYAAQLRCAGVEVDELRYTAPGPDMAARIRNGPELLADLGAALSIEESHARHD